MPGIIFLLKYPGQFFLFNRDSENVSEYSVLRNYLQKYMQNGNNNARLKKVPLKSSPDLGGTDSKIISTWNFGIIYSVSKNAIYVKNKFITYLQ